MHFIEVDVRNAPLSLLFEADPSKQRINAYLEGSWCFAAKQQDDISGICVVKPIQADVAEIFNISVTSTYQKKGIGTDLLKFTLAQLSDKGIKRVELGTGTFGYQLTFYQRLGFRVDRVVKNHFTDNYTQSIFETGIQHKDMLRLSLSLR